jgi:hypothetical protein
MLTLQASGGDLVAYFVALVPVLRAVLPYRWWYRFVGDPVRLILSLPPELTRKVLQALVTVPGGIRDISQDPDGIEALRQMQRRAVYGDREPGGVSLAVAALSVREKFGDAWYYNPDRWPTSDGYVPFAVALAEHAGAQALDVRRSLEVADGYGLAHAKNPRQARQQMQQLAYPSEVC